MTLNRLLIALTSIPLLLFSCKSEEEDTNTSDPSNLSVEMNVSEDGSGIVNIVATADNVTEFQFHMDEEEDVFESNTTGTLDYTYTVFGVYDVEVRAYGASGRFVSETKEISIKVGDEGGPITLEDGYITPTSYEGMTLVWNDEFDGSSLNTSDWTYEIGTGSNGWGNNELQYYTASNTQVADGVLTIEAKEEIIDNSNYTSSRIITKDKRSFQYGRVDIRAVLPQGKGIWPALWMLGSNISSVGWPACGEIDIMEMVGGETTNDEVHGTIHWEEGGTRQFEGGEIALEEGIFADEYHVFSIIWDESQIKWFLDDVLFHTESITNEARSEFHNDFFFIFNIAVGGDWPGSPSADTDFPQRMMVDYIRVFQEN